MERREFLGASIAVFAAAGLESQSDAASAQEREKGAMREYYELRLVHFATAQAQERYGNYLKAALLPALARAGAGPVGVFAQTADAAEHAFYLLVPFTSLESYAATAARLEKDAEYLKAGADVLELPATDPPFVRTESWLLHAFEGFPKLHAPAEAASGKGRQFELRTYESHSRKANKKKIEMFNAGEAAIFARHGLQPVFFGETLTGPQIPNLTYLLAYPSMEERAGLWKEWGADPEMKRLFAIPEYADRLIVSRIHQTYLKPLPGSMI